MRILTLPACLVVMVAPPLHSQAAPTAPANARHWGLAPSVFPKGARMAVVSGDPGKAGRFTIQLAVPPGYKIPPHFHPPGEMVTVKKGTVLLGLGEPLHGPEAQPLQ